MAASEPCLEENELLDLVMGSLDADRVARAEAHIDECAGCRLVLSELARIYELKASGVSVEDTPSTDTDEGVPNILPPELMRGGQVARYLVLEALGAGAMGVVYAAYDPQLDRKVALKLLRSHRVEAAHGDRLLREARAIAKLAHPNVVVVHDVGLHDEALFMAMEFVDGGTLADWQEGKSRAEVLAAYADAARGLAAAHRADIVHRDFKPANVLIGRDGRVRVTDFGLARLGESAATIETLPMLDVESRSDVLTKTGTIVGTPAYMSPEQFEGRSADARSDQFSFCVALYEALCGERPFQGRTFAELELNVFEGELRDNAAFSALPRPLRLALKRGLSVDPRQRFDGMEALLSALEPSVGRSRWAPAIFGGVAALGMGVFGFTMGSRAEEPCAAELQAFSSVWTPERKTRLREDFVDSGHAYAADVADGVTSRVDDYVQRWGSSFETACVVSPQSAEVDCLRDRRRDFERLLDALEQGGADVVEFAVQAVDRLEDPTACSTGEALGIVPPPTPPASLVERVEDFETRLSSANALLETRQYERALEEASGVRTAALEAEYAPSVAEAELIMGQALAVLDRVEEAESTLVAAARRAWTSGHERVALDAAVELVIIAGVLRHKPDAGDVWSEFSGATLDRAGVMKRAEALLFEHRGALAHHRREFEEAEEFLLHALELREASMPAGSTPIASVVSRLAAAALEQERFEEGLAYADRALAIHQAALGNVHPMVMRDQSLRGVALLQLGRLDEAEEASKEALRVGEQTLGRHDPRLVDVRNSLATLASRRGDYEAAEVRYQELLDALLADGGTENPVVPIVMHNMGAMSMHAGNLELAKDRFERVIELREAEPAGAISSLGMLAVVEMELGQCDAALEHAQRAMSLLQTAGRGEKQRLHIEGTLANTLLCTGEVRRALELARESFAKTETGDLRPDRGAVAEILADAEFAAGNRAASEAAARVALEEAGDAASKAAAQFRLARATIDLDREGALAQAREALPLARRSDRAQIESFLAAHDR